MEEELLDSPVNRIGVVVSNELNAFASLRSQELVAEFSNVQFSVMNEFCKECADPAFDRDVYPMLLQAYASWHNCYQQTTRGDLLAINNDIHVYASRLSIHYYFNPVKSAIVLFADLIPEWMQNNQFEYMLMMNGRVMHEGVLNSIH